MANLFTSQTPASNNFDASPLTLATTVIFAVNGQVTGGRFFARNVNSGGTFELVLWIPTVEDIGGVGAGTVLASATYGAITPGDWNSIVFSSPVSVVAGQPYKIGLRTSNGQYTSTAAFFASPLVNGNITGPQGSTLTPGYGTFYNGSYQTNNTGYPNQTFNNTCYFVDVDFTPSGGPPVVDLAAALSGTGTLTAALVREVNAAAGLSGGGTLSAALVREANLAAGLSGTGSLSVALAREVTLSAALSGGGTMAAAPVVETTLRAALSGSGTMAATFTVPTVQRVDPIASPVALALLACLTEQMNPLPSPPARIQLRVGAETGPLIGPNVDECCAGLAWVRVADVYPSWDSFPAPDNTWLPCGPLAYAVVLEMGTAFCMPWSDSEDGFENIDPPSTGDWQSAFTTLMTHQNLLRKAAACCFAPTQRRAVGGWTPLSVEGGCTGGTLTVTVSVMAPCGDC